MPFHDSFGISGLAFVQHFTNADYGDQSRRKGGLCLEVYRVVRFSEKLSPFECGFTPFDDARGQFDVRFYLVAILFIIFDLEVAFLFPWAVTLGEIGLFGFWSMMLFLGVLTVGFIYEWRKGALEWE